MSSVLITGCSKVDWRGGMTDEEWVILNSSDDETYAKSAKAWTDK